MDPRQWQQPDPTAGYGQTPPGGYPPQPPQYPPQQPPQPQYPQPQYPPQQYPQAQPPQQPPQPQYPQPQYPPRQPVAQPYSAMPYATQPYSAPPAYQQPPMSPAQSGPPAPPGRRNRWFAALVISSVLLVVLVVAIVVVSLNRKPDATGGPQATSSQTGPVEQCLVGKWKQTSYQHYVDLSTTDVGKREKLGKIKFTGGGKIWEIRADGNAVEDDTKTVYSGKTDDGRTVNASWAGRTEWKVSTKDGVLSFAGGEATTVVTISVDGSEKGRIELQPNLDPTPYTCNGDIWRTSGKDSADDFARYDREQ
ncbi:lipocalin family protein [Dactylosporangium sp. NPDC048998]|uniref:lipocalin family protein n=1 Tax=Dactylosporangium sp. NPDC048998 TaxID=3363976 RepID=UPI00371370E9